MTIWNTFGRTARSFVLLLAIPALLFGCGGGGSSNTATSHTVTATAATGGTISPASTTVDDGAIANLTVTPDSGYAISSVSGCGGTLSGNTYTTGAITADCTVTANFIVPAAVTHTVTATAGTGGAISPANATVNDGATTSFTVTPDSGYAISSVSGCGGTLSGTTYTTGAISADCSVSASFIMATHTVTAAASTGGVISPAKATVDDGATTSFTVTPDSGYSIDSVSGCGGTLSGNTYTTGAVIADCTVFASFALNTYTVGGTVSGLSGPGLVLQNNDIDDLPVAGVSFTFATALNHGSHYNVTVLTQPSGQSCTVGNGSGILNGANVTDVSITCKGWGTAGLIESDDTGDASGPQIAIDSSGNALAVWQQRDGTRYNIWANRYTAGSGWGSATLIESDNTGNASSPQIAIDSSGNALAVWSQSDGTRNNIWANHYIAGSGWGTAELIESDNTGSAGSPQIAIDNNGNALAVWQQQNGASFNIWANRYTAGSGWGTAELIESGAGPQIAIDGSGNALAVWQQDDGTLNNIRANRYIAGSGWGTAELIESGAGNALAPQIAIYGNGNALAVWAQDDGTSNIWGNRYIAGSGWGTAELIENDNTGHAYSPQIAIDGSGNVLAVWQHYDGTRYTIWANRYTAGSGWGTAELIESGAGNAQNPQIAIDSSGNALAVWQETNGGRLSIWANRYIAGSGWGTAELIENDDTGDASGPQIAIDGNDNALAVWQQDDGTRVNIQANRFE